MLGQVSAPSGKRFSDVQSQIWIKFSTGQVGPDTELSNRALTVYVQTGRERDK